MNNATHALHQLGQRLWLSNTTRTYSTHHALLAAKRWQRLLWASTGTKDAAALDTLHVQALVARLAHTHTRKTCRSGKQNITPCNAQPQSHGQRLVS